MARKQDIKTLSVEVTATAENIGDRIPEQMSRYITFLKYANRDDGANEITVQARVGTTDKQLDMQPLGGKQTLAFPDKPDINNPIMKVVGSGASTMIRTFCSAVSGIVLTMTYYDE